MPDTLTLFAHIEAEPNHIELVKRELLALIETTRSEDGCLQYDLHQDNENPAVFKFFERWESRELWQAHMQSAHLAAYMKATDGAVADFVLHEMSRIGDG